jgi:3-oxoacyl-[acyl-carrier-protein] synthase-3
VTDVMTGTGPFLTAPRYVLGADDADHATIPGLHARARDLRMAPDARAWGWGRIRRARQSRAQLAVDSGSVTLAAADVDPASIDLLVLCSTHFPHGAEPQGRFMEAILTGLKLSNAEFAGVTMNRCANLVVALHLVRSLVASGLHRRVLVVTTDRVVDEAARMEGFALFSDGAASCLVLADGSGRPGYHLVASATATDAASLGSSSEISPALARQVSQRLLSPLGLAVADVAGLLHSNVFTPILVMSELQAGFTQDQLYTRNITRVGHCFAADPLINLVDQADAGLLREHGYYMLASSVPGTRAGVLLRKEAGPR